VDECKPLPPTQALNAAAAADRLMRRCSACARARHTFCARTAFDQPCSPTASAAVDQSRALSATSQKASGPD